MEKPVRVMLADDDTLVLEDLSHLIDWEAEGYALSAVCENGRDALRCLESGQADMVIADIEMPVMDGLRFARKVHEDYPWIPVLLLTAYSRFDYAKDAVSAGVFDYALKHELDAKKLLEYLSAMKKRLEESKIQTQVERMEAIRRILMGEDFKEEPLWKTLRFSAGKNVAVLALVRKRERVSVLLQNGTPAADPHGFCRQVKELLQPVEASGNLSVWTGGAQYCFALLESRGNAAEDARFWEAVNQALGPYCIVILTDALMTADALREGYQALLAAIDRVFYLPADCRSIKISDLPQAEQGVSLGTPSGMDVHGAPKEIQFCLEVLRRVAAPQGVYLEALQDVLEELERLECSVAQTAPCTVTELLEEARCAQDCEDLLCARAQWIASAEQGQFSEKVQYLLREVRAQCGRDDALDYLARQMGLNKDYMSKLFKKETGRTLGEYLLDCRMKKAQRLLSSGDYKVYQVAEMVGYHSSQYFSQVYQKYYQKTPTDRGKET